MKAISNNTAEFAGGMKMTTSLHELRERMYETQAVEETRTADEIISHMKNKLAFLGEKEE